MLDGKRIAILAEDDFEDSELIEPLRSMKNAGARVVIVGTGSRKSYQGKRGNASVSAWSHRARVPVPGILSYPPLETVRQGRISLRTKCR